MNDSKQEATLDEATAVIHDAKVEDGTHYCGTFKDPRNGCEVWFEAEATLGYLIAAGLLHLREEVAP